VSEEIAVTLSIGGRLCDSYKRRKRDHDECSLDGTPGFEADVTYPPLTPEEIMELAEDRAAHKTFSDAVWMLGIAGILIAVLGNILLHPLAWLLGATPHILGEAADYLWFIVTFAPFQLFSFLLGSMVRNDGRPKLAMTAIILGAVSNIALDHMFMYPLNMGIKGAALATALGPIFRLWMIRLNTLSSTTCIPTGRSCLPNSRMS